MRIDGIVFDMDATLVNLGGYVDWSLAHNNAKEAYIECGFSPDLIRQVEEKNLFTMLNHVWEDKSSQLNFESLCKAQEAAFTAVEKCELLGINQCKLLPGCEIALDWINAHGISMGVATTNSEIVAKKVLVKNGIRKYFDSIVGRRPNLRLKPYPDQIIQCLQEMGVPRIGGLMVGDSVKDVKAANAAKIPIISIPFRFTKRQDIEKFHVDFIINNLFELPNVLKEIIGIK